MSLSGSIVTSYFWQWVTEQNTVGILSYASGKVVSLAAYL